MEALSHHLQLKTACSPLMWNLKSARQGCPGHLEEGFSFSPQLLLVQHHPAVFKTEFLLDLPAKEMN